MSPRPPQRSLYIDGPRQTSAAKSSHGSSGSLQLLRHRRGGGLHAAAGREALVRRLPLFGGAVEEECGVVESLDLEPEELKDFFTQGRTLKAAAPNSRLSWKTVHARLKESMIRQRTHRIVRESTPEGRPLHLVEIYMRTERIKTFKKTCSTYSRTCATYLVRSISCISILMLHISISTVTGLISKKHKVDELYRSDALFRAPLDALSSTNMLSRLCILRFWQDFPS